MALDARARHSPLGRSFALVVAVVGRAARVSASKPVLSFELAAVRSELKSRRMQIYSTPPRHLGYLVDSRRFGMRMGAGRGVGRDTESHTHTRDRTTGFSRPHFRTTRIPHEFFFCRQLTLATWNDSWDIVFGTLNFGHVGYPFFLWDSWILLRIGITPKN